MMKFCFIFIPILCSLYSCEKEPAAQNLIYKCRKIYGYGGAGGSGIGLDSVIMVKVYIAANAKECIVYDSVYTFDRVVTCELDENSLYGFLSDFRGITATGYFYANRDSLVYNKDMVISSGIRDYSRCKCGIVK